ncbi:MAG TPA: flagellar basal body rod protein FlgC [Acidobacteriaceae bacterium]|jgi:flagellar basal-body rod protein FlgC
MNLFGVLGVSGSALTAERVRAEVTASNMANAETTHTSDGKLFQRQHVVFQSIGPTSSDDSTIGTMGGSFANAFATQMGPQMNNALTSGTPDEGGVEVAGFVTDNSPGLRRYDPGHPDADKDGYVTYPDIDPLTEMVDLMGATRAYGLNVSAVQATKSMIGASLDILK